MEHASLLAAAFFAVALLYASVGHGGASGYLALMGLAQFPIDTMRPLALCMNLGVASIAAWQYRSHLQIQRFWPLLFGVPMAYLGGRYRLTESSYAWVLGVTLLFSAAWLLRPKQDQTPRRDLPATWAGGLGASLGLLAGLTGIGGGVFLSPVLMLGRFASAKQTGAIAALFIACNSAAGLLAQRAQLTMLPSASPLWIFAAIVGGTIGAYWGAKTLDEPWLRSLLALALAVASGNLLYRAWLAV